MLTPFSRSIGLAFLFMGLLAIQGRAQEATSSITATVLASRNTNREVIYKIAYSYDFVGRNSVFVDGVGVVAGRGRLAYYSYDSNIVFRESMAGRILLIVALLGPDVYTGSVSITPDFPDESEFPKSYRSNVWPYSANFQIIANDVLNKMFESGYRAYSANNENYIHTTFAQLKNLPPNLVAQISILLSHPYDVRNREFEYRVQFIARERRIQSGKWRYDLSDETRESAENFVNHVIDKLNENGKKRR